jgi:hypothetical protein
MLRSETWKAYGFRKDWSNRFFGFDAEMWAVGKPFSAEKKLEIICSFGAKSFFAISIGEIVKLKYFLLVVFAPPPPVPFLPKKKI